LYRRLVKISGNWVWVRPGKLSENTSLRTHHGDGGTQDVFSACSPASPRLYLRGRFGSPSLEKAIDLGQSRPLAAV